MEAGNGIPATGGDVENGQRQNDGRVKVDEPKVVRGKPVPAVEPKPLPKEIGGTTGPELTRYGDWEHKGRCTDF